MTRASSSASAGDVSAPSVSRTSAGASGATGTSSKRSGAASIQRRARAVKRVLTMKRLRLCASARASSGSAERRPGSSRTCAVRGFHPAETIAGPPSAFDAFIRNISMASNAAARRSPSSCARRRPRCRPICPLPETLAPPAVCPPPPCRHCGRTATRSSPRGSNARASSRRVRDRCADSSAAQAHGGGVADARCVRCRIRQRARGRTCRQWTRAWRRAIADREEVGRPVMPASTTCACIRVRDHERRVRHVSGRQRTRARRARTNEDGRHGTTTEERSKNREA